MHQSISIDDFPFAVEPAAASREANHIPPHREPSAPRAAHAPKAFGRSRAFSDEPERMRRSLSAQRQPRVLASLWARARHS